VVTWSLDYVNEEGAPLDSGFDDAGPFSVSPDADGVALDAALREFGPAAFEDLLPRLRMLAADLDAAHTTGFIHGRLHPSKVFVTDDATYLIGARVPQVVNPSAARGAGDTRQWPVQLPYSAPEVIDGTAPSPASDQYSLAAIAYEWMFGRPIGGPAERSIEVRAVPNVDRAELARAFTRALAPEPFRRFASCTDFCDAIAAASAPALPLLSMADDEVDEHLEPFVPEDKPAPAEPIVAAVPVAAAAPMPDLSFTAEESNVTAAEPDLDSFERAAVAAPPAQLAADDTDRFDPTPAAPPAFATVTAASSRDGQRFGGFALILAAIVGAIFGFAAGYMARPRALQSAPPQARAAEPIEKPEPAAPAAPSPAVPAPEKSAPKAADAPAKIGRLLVRSTPPGATVEVDGVSRGVTPLALRELDLGAREITVSRRGYVSEARRIVLTRARPSRSVEVRLASAAAAARPGTTPAPRPATPASLGKPAVTTGTLAIESRPTGAAVTVNGNSVGVTPLTMGDLPPGDYRVTFTLTGYRTFATTVRVVAGERARAAARLTEQEQE
jgi:hypothetical protein